MREREKGTEERRKMYIWRRRQLEEKVQGSQKREVRGENEERYGEEGRNKGEDEREIKMPGRS